MGWHSMHVHYHEERLDDLILDAVRPLFDQIHQDTTRVGDRIRTYFVPHWRRGPHLRLNFGIESTEPGAVWRTRVRPAVERIVGGYLERSPSISTMDPYALLAMHERLAAAEQEPGPLLPWRSNNSILPAPHDNRRAVLGSREAADELIRFYVDGTDLTFRMLRAVRTGASRLALAFGLMVATAHRHAEGGIVRGSLSFRSHAEAFLSNTPEGPTLREHWDRYYRRHAERLSQELAAVIASVDQRSGQPLGQPSGRADSANGTAGRSGIDGSAVAANRPVSFVAAWLDLLDRRSGRGRELIESGRIALTQQVRRGERTPTAGFRGGPLVSGVDSADSAPPPAGPALPAGPGLSAGSGRSARQGHAIGPASVPAASVPAASVPAARSPAEVSGTAEADLAMSALGEFHRQLVGTDWWRATRTSVWFLHYRLLLNYTYLQLTRLGVRPVERFMLGHLAANAVEDLYQISALEEIRP